MKPAKKLVLKREALTELSGSELEQVAGGQHTIPCISQIIHPCITDQPICTALSRIIDPCIP